MSFFSDKWRGIILCAVLAVPCWFLGKLVPVVGAPVFAILLGMLVALVWPVEAAFKSGVGFVSKKVLQYAVILLGFGLNISVVLATGKQSLPIIVCTIATSLIVAYVLHKVMHIPGKISTLIGVGSSICGGSAVAATAPVIKADDEEVAQAISVIFFFNVLAALLFPWLGTVLGFSTISEVAIVQTIIGNDCLPVASTTEIFRPKPSRITAYCNTFLDTKPTPLLNAACTGHTSATSMPKRIAKTGAPTTGTSLPKNQHGTAKTAHKIIPRHLSEKKLTITPP